MLKRRSAAAAGWNWYARAGQGRGFAGARHVAPAKARGKPSITAEAGHAGTTETDDIAALVNGSVNVMRYLKMLTGVAAVVENPVWVEKIAAVTSDQTGIYGGSMAA